MRHEQILDHLSEYVEGNLDAAMSAAVELHTKNCADCYRELMLMRQVYEELGNPGLMKEPPGRFHDDVMRKVRLYNQGTAADQGFFSKFRWGWALSSAAGIVAVALALSLTSPPQKSVTPAGISVDRNRPSTPASTTEKASLLVGRSGSQNATGRYTIAIRPDQPGQWRLTARTSQGISLENTLPLGNDGDRLLWQGEASGNRDTFIILQAKSAGAGSVSEVLVELEQTDQTGKTQRLVIAPPTDRVEGPRGSLPLRPDDNARSTARVISSTYGVTIVAPVNVLDRSVTVSVNPGSAERAVGELAESLGLKYTNYRGVYNLHP